MPSAPVRQPTTNMPLDSTPNGAMPTDLQYVATVTSPRDPGGIPGGSQDHTLPNPKD
jgi:hypothetical protein